MIWPFKRSKSEGKPERAPLDLNEAAARGIQAPDRDELIAGSIQAIAVDTFPDNADNEWHIRRSIHLGDRSYVLVEPSPDDVGYSAFVFLVVLGSSSHSPESPAVYCLEDPGTYDLLCTSTDCPADIPSVITW